MRLETYLRLATRTAKSSVANHLGRHRIPLLGPTLLAPVGRVLAHAKPRAIVRALQRDVPFGPCEAGRFVGVLLPDGELRACELRPESLGNVRHYNYDLGAAWSSSAARATRRTIRAERCRCTHECYVNPTLALHPFALARALAGPL